MIFKGIDLCSDAYVPNAHETVGVTGYDIVIYVTVEADPTTDFVAWASPCIFDSS